MSEMIELTIDGIPTGECDQDTFGLVKLYMSEGRENADIAAELKANGIENALTIVINARREVRHHSGAL